MLKMKRMLALARAVEGRGYKLADRIVVIGGAFATHIQSLGVTGWRITEIPNWADVDSIRPQRPSREVRRRLGADAKDFLVVYTGNMGAKQDLLNVVGAAALFNSQERIKFALIGDGQERSRVAAEIVERNLQNITLLPLQSSTEFPTVLGAADVLLISQAPMITDSVLPSKLLAYMASARPVLAAAHRNSSTAELIRRAGCGVVTDPGRPEALAEAIRSLAAERNVNNSLSNLGLRGRAHVLEHYNRTSILQQWDSLLSSLHRS
jgi:glycosyltransferase involved in cell wall biosynthesis